MGNAILDQVYWFSIAISLVVVFFLSVSIAAYLIGGDFARYKRVALDEESAEDQRQEIGWKLVQAEVFRPPSFSPFLLPVACGTGAQIQCASLLTIICLVTGFLSPANRGALIMAALSLYVMMGGVAGKVTARLYKTINGTSRKQATTFTALGFPVIVFCFLFCLNLVTRGQGSSDTVPFTAVVILIVLWLGISTPLVFIGAYFGYKQGAIPFPVKISTTPCQIPHQPWFMSIPLLHLFNRRYSPIRSLLRQSFLYSCLGLDAPILQCLWFPAD
ncbi:Nonaspanin (TM9SF) [Fragilaria crotonensis]|nr:Nonaspanin (TM9SF) [Fragilaria crotonensis]